MSDKILDRKMHALHLPCAVTLLMSTYLAKELGQPHGGSRGSGWIPRVVRKVSASALSTAASTSPPRAREFWGAPCCMGNPFLCTVGEKFRAARAWVHYGPWRHSAGQHTRRIRPAAAVCLLRGCLSARSPRSTSAGARGSRVRRCTRLFFAVVSHDDIWG